MKKTFIFLTTLFTLFITSACTNQIEQYDIVTTMYTPYDLAKQIAGDKLTVSMLVPLGQDIHSFNASSNDMIQIENAKLFLYTSNEIDTWISDPDQIGGKDTIVANMSEAVHHDEPVSLLADTDHDHDVDIHYWVDPFAAIDMLNYIYNYIVQIDPDNEAYYEINRDNYNDDIMSIYDDMIAYFSDTAHQDKTIYFAGHNAMTPFGNRIGVHIEALFSEFKPDDDLTSNELITFSNAVKTANVHYLFIEALEVPTAANAIKAALANEGYDLTLLELHSYHNLSQDDWDNYITYVDLMQRNFNAIKIALGESI